MKPPKYTDSHKYPNGYRKAAETDISKTFARIKSQLKTNQEELSVKVKPLIRAKV